MATNASQLFDSCRKADAVLIICQNNTKKLLEIAAINEEAARLIGYANDAVVGRPLSLILPERVSGVIDEYIEFEEGMNDLSSVLSKLRNFAIKKQDGKETEFKIRIISGQPIDHNPCFHLVLIDEEKTRDNKAFRAIIKENFKGHEVLDPNTGLPNRLSLIKDAELAIYYVRGNNIKASFAIVDINDYDALQANHGKETSRELQQHISQIFKQKLRAEDTIGTLSDRALGIILVDAKQEEALMVLNRMRWAIGNSPVNINGKEIPVQVNVYYAQIDGKIDQIEILESCEEFMHSQREIARNSLQLVVTHERRDGKKERRQKNVPVAVERRKGNRRTPTEQ